MNLEALVGTLVVGNDRRVADQWVMDTRIWDQIGLEFVQVHVESAIKSQAQGD